MATPTSAPDPTPGTQPKIVQKLLVRTAGFLFAFAALFGALRWFQDKKGDYDNGGDSVGMIAAIRLERDGQQAVLIKPDGTIVPTKSWKAGVNDREPVWAPDGRYLFFCSDREESTYNIFRWNPQKDDAESRTFGRISRANPTFAPGGGLDSLLIVAGGTVRELDPQTKRTPQVLPPANGEIAQSSGDEGGSTTDGAFSSIYGGLGKSFRVARYVNDKRYIAAILRRDEGELLILQDLEVKNDRVPKPMPVAAGDRIEFDINPKDGTIVYSIQNFRWPDPKVAPAEFRKGNRVTVPFRNVVGILDPANGQSIVAASPDDKVGFGSPRVSPDGSRMLLIQGKMEDGNLIPGGLLTLPYRQGGIQQGSPLVKGEVYEPTWSHDGSQIAYAKHVNGKRDLFTMGSEGTNETSLTKGQGDFAMPLFSPMAKQ